MRIRQRKRAQFIGDRVLVAGFLALLFLPLCAMVLPAYRVHKSLDDTTAPMPAFSVHLADRFPQLRAAVVGFNAVREFLHDFKGSMVLRDEIVCWHGVAQVKWLGASNSPDVLLGKRDWLYLTSEGSVEDFRRLTPYTPNELQQMRAALEATQNRLAKRGSHFLLIVAPNKQTIYPEFMPDDLRPLSGPTRLDQFLAFMKTSKVSVLDLRPALLHAKKAEPVYGPTDTHWNALGALAAYSATAARLKAWYPDLQIATRRDFRITSRTAKGGDMARMLGIQNAIWENRVVIEPRAPRVFAAPKTLPAQSKTHYYPIQIQTRQPDAEISRALVFGDSFIFLTDYQPLLAQHFRDATWLRFGDERVLDFDLIERSHPDLVIFQTVERYLSAVASPKPNS